MCRHVVRSHTRAVMDDDTVDVIETCSVCGEGQPLSSGAFRGYDGARVRWALWTCGHGWRSDATRVGALTDERLD